MSTLQLVEQSPPTGEPYKFRDFGPHEKFLKHTPIQKIGGFPSQTLYELTRGNFPITDKDLDLFDKGELYYTLNTNIEVKVLGFDIACLKENINQYGQYGKCAIIVELVNKKATVGGRKKSILKNKSNRKKSNRRR